MENEPSHRHASFEIKSADLPLVALLLKTEELKIVEEELLREFGPESESPDFFDHDGLVIDFSCVKRDVSTEELRRLITALKACSLLPVAIRNAPKESIERARLLGLAEAMPEVHRIKHAPTNDNKPIEIVKEIVREVVHEVPGPQTMVVDKPLRSGQKVYARGADLVVLAMVNQGAEVVADGNIHVYAPLRGKAMAGARGNTDARIFSLCLEPELISIAGVYRTSENALPQDVQSKPAQVRLSNDGQEKLLIEPLKS